jgi:hypothetical protein
VDGALVGTSPLPADIFVDAGQHTLGARIGVGSAVERSVTVAAGKDYPVELSLNPKAATPVPSSDASPPALSIPPASDSSVSAKTVALITGGAVTAVLLGVGIAERIRASDADDDAAAVRERLPTNCDASTPSALCRELTNNLDRRNSANKVAIVTFAGAGLAAAATAAIWLIWEAPRTSASAAPRAEARSRSGRPKVLIDVAPHNASISFATNF